MSTERIALIDSPEDETNDILKSVVLGNSEESNKISKMKVSLSKINAILKSLGKHTKRMSVKSSQDISSDIADSIVVISYKKKD
jgi:hypothetical protein